MAVEICTKGKKDLANTTQEVRMASDKKRKGAKRNVGGKGTRGRKRRQTNLEKKRSVHREGDLAIGGGEKTEKNREVTEG